MQNHTNPKRSFVSFLFYRLSQFIGFLLSIHIFTTITLAIALYVSTVFLFSNAIDLKEFIFDFKVHAIIISSLFSILSGRIINQFYDKEKDALSKPFNTKFQHFLQQKYYLYTYVAFNIISLLIAISVSHRVLIFFLVYQFLIWFYSHKLSKIVIINNLTFVALTLYPFFGVLVYYKTFSSKIALLAVFLLIILLLIDIVKDVLTKNVDKVFGYQTIPNMLGTRFTKMSIVVLFGILILNSILIVKTLQSSIMDLYFSLSVLIAIVGGIITVWQFKNSWLIILNVLRLWVFLGILFMLFDGIYAHFQ